MSWENDDLKIGGYLEEGLRVGLSGVFNLAITTEQLLLYSTKDGNWRSTLSTGVELSYGTIKASLKASYSFKPNDFSNGTFSLASSISSSLLNNMVSINAGYTYKYDYENRSVEHIMSLGLSSGKSAKLGSYKYGGVLAYSIKVSEKDNNKSSNFSFDFFLENGDLTRKVSHKKDTYDTSLSEIVRRDFENYIPTGKTWTVDYMKRASSFPKHTPFTKWERFSFERLIYNRFGIKVYSK